MAKKSHYKKKGLSTIVTTLILVLLSIVAVGVIWVFINNTIKNQMKSSESCLGNYNKIKLHGQYVCYERVSTTNYSLRFSISVGDANPDKVIVSVASGGEIKGYTLTNSTQNITGLYNYPSNTTGIVLPSANGGKTYTARGFTTGIDSIKIAPVINGNMCEVSDSIFEIENCASMA